MENIKQFLNIPYEVRKSCAVCEAKLDEPIIELPDLPITEVYTTKPVEEKVGFVDQNFHICRRCGHGQLSHIVDPKFLYNEAFFHKTSESVTARSATDFLVSFLNRVVKEREFSNIIEIGCNDLYLLRLLKSRSKRLVGIDPVISSRNISDEGIELVGDFVENIDLEKLLDEKVDLVLSTFTLEHIKEPRVLFKQLLEVADENSIFIFKFPGLETLLNNYRFDQIFHQHLQYFSLQSIIYLLEEFNGELIDYESNFHHWGGLLVAFKKNSLNKKWKFKFTNEFTSITEEDVKKRYQHFQLQMWLADSQLRSMNSENIYGYGAALMLPVLSYHLKNDLSCLEYVIDDDKSKEGLYYINLPVRIRTPGDIREYYNSVIFVTAIDNASRIIPRAISLGPKKVILPINIIV